MKPILFALFNSLKLALSIQKHHDIELGNLELRQFPDGETYLKINSDVKNRSIILLASLNQPNEKILPLLLIAETIKTLGAKEIGLITPYLAYMRQDKAFHPGESVTSIYFAALLSQHVDWLITIDPHLHRYHSLNEIYSIPTKVLHATDIIGNWIKQHIDKPLLIGPDQESQQWVEEIATIADTPFIVLEKLRKGDRHVEIRLPSIDKYKHCTPVLVDDIISTGKTMLAVIEELKKTDLAAPVCIGIHAVFADNAYEELLASGAQKVLTCNTITHPSNVIDLAPLIAEAVILI